MSWRSRRSARARSGPCSTSTRRCGAKRAASRLPVGHQAGRRDHQRGPVEPAGLPSRSAGGPASAPSCPGPCRRRGCRRGRCSRRNCSQARPCCWYGRNCASNPGGASIGSMCANWARRLPSARRASPPSHFSGTAESRSARRTTSSFDRRSRSDESSSSSSWSTPTSGRTRASGTGRMRPSSSRISIDSSGSMPSAGFGEQFRPGAQRVEQHRQQVDAPAVDIDLQPQVEPVAAGLDDFGMPFAGFHRREAEALVELHLPALCPQGRDSLGHEVEPCLFALERVIVLVRLRDVALAAVHLHESRLGERRVRTFLSSVVAPQAQQLAVADDRHHGRTVAIGAHAGVLEAQRGDVDELAACVASAPVAVHGLEGIQAQDRYRRGFARLGLHRNLRQRAHHAGDRCATARRARAPHVRRRSRARRRARRRSKARRPLRWARTRRSSVRCTTAVPAAAAPLRAGRSRRWCVAHRSSCSATRPARDAAVLRAAARRRSDSSGTGRSRAALEVRRTRFPHRAGTRRS